jgi:hypothetical protein
MMLVKVEGFFPQKCVGREANVLWVFHQLNIFSLIFMYVCHILSEIVGELY